MRALSLFLTMLLLSMATAFAHPHRSVRRAHKPAVAEAKARAHQRNMIRKIMPRGKRLPVHRYRATYGRWV
ncbi:MAG: hypothetical protein FJW30_08705 [Acidobacteria bacterium]|nr:hypothetical protein [Acidobacteriota bacterium]